MCSSPNRRPLAAAAAAAGVILVVQAAVPLPWTVQADARVPAGQPPVLSAVQPPSDQPQGYWICVQSSNGQCHTWKTCIKWQGGNCEMWVYVTSTGSMWCTGPGWWQRVDCPPVASRLSSSPGAGRGTQVWVGQLQSDSGAPAGVSVVLVAHGGAVLLIKASAETCSAEARAWLAELALLWAGKDRQARQIWSDAGCTVSIAHPDFQEWLRSPRIEQPGPGDTGQQGGPGR